MRKFATAIACVICLATSAQAQVPLATTQMFVPSPLGVVLMVGKWIYDSATRQEVYYIEVAGDGATAEQARNNGFRLAVEQAIGSLISSETEVENGRIRRDEIINYASGFVTRFEIVNQQATATGVRVSMRVWVKRSALSDRLLNRSQQAGQVDGATASVQLQTLNQERATGDALVRTVLNDFPRRAFDIELDPADVVRDNRSAAIEVPFAVTWNQHYLKSLWTALEATAHKGNNARSVIGVNPGSGWMFKSYGGQARFDDTVKYELLVNAMVRSEPTVRIAVKSANGSILRLACYNYQELDHQPGYVVSNRRFVELSPYQPTAFVDGSYKLRGRVKIPMNLTQLREANSVEIDVVPRSQCPIR